MGRGGPSGPAGPAVVPARWQRASHVMAAMGRAASLYSAVSTSLPHEEIAACIRRMTQVQQCFRNPRLPTSVLTTYATKGSLDVSEGSLGCCSRASLLCFGPCTT